MADKPISQLDPSTIDMIAGDEFAINRSGSNFKINAQQLAAGVLSINGQTIKDIVFSGTQVTVTYTDNSTETYTLPSSGGSTAIGPFLKITGTTSKFIGELTSATNLQVTDFLHLGRDGFDGKITLDQLNDFIQSNLTLPSGNLSIARFETSGRSIITYSGTTPTVGRSGNNMNINCATDTLIQSVDATVQSPSDQSGDTSYSVNFIYPTNIIQTMSYNGSIDQCPCPSLSISTVTSNKMEKSFEGMFVNNNANGLTAVFPDAFPAQGAKRRLSIIF